MLSIRTLLQGGQLPADSHIIEKTRITVVCMPLFRQLTGSDSAAAG